ncbi:hypothetical protein Tco_0682851 [Tanacetum coccineum]|uniref:Uncharacterized protein n=1 Tax=Tanacetum coccineum TaxID=301880 RepID=A0ABQ4XTA5_9ASTR
MLVFDSDTMRFMLEPNHPEGSSTPVQKEPPLLLPSGTLYLTMRGEKGWGEWVVNEQQQKIKKIDGLISYGVLHTLQIYMENGVNLTIPPEIFLHEVAFKLWKAPKYGA